MTVTLHNDLLTVAIEDKGAQLASILGADGVQYLWQGDPEIWARRAPILFPIIGRLKGGQYTLGDRTYTIGQHGFARDMVFAVTEQSDTSVSFQLTDTQQTRLVYPFAFRLTVTYSLEGSRLTKHHLVENCSDTTMYYELGAHDGFRAPLAAGERMSDYAVRLPGLDAIRPYGMDGACMLTPQGKSYPLSNGRMPLTPATYGLDTVVLPCPLQGRVMLVDGLDRPRVTLECAQFPYLGIWTQNKPFPTNYVCIEPWSTLPDAVFCGRGLADKPGIRILAPGACEALAYTTVFE